jgi:hypothetical protein
MLQIGTGEISVVTAKAAQTIRSLTEKVASLEQENSLLLQKLASAERDKQIEQLARDMEEKGLNSFMTFEEKVANLRSHQHLDNVQEAVKMASAGNIRIGEISDRPGAGILDPLTSFCLTGS